MLARALASRSELPKPQDGPVGSCARHCGPNVLRRLVARQESLMPPLRAVAGGSPPAPAAITRTGGARLQAAQLSLVCVPALLAC